MDNFLETTLFDLYKNTQIAFPKTQKRQFSIDPVVVENLTWVPFLGMKTLFIKGLVKSESKKYDCMVLFKKVNFKESEGKKIIKIKMSTGKNYFVEQLSTIKNDVLLRCNCLDFYYRFNYYNHLDKSLYGRKRKKYYGKDLWKANPAELPGMCKHIIKLIKVVKESDLLVEK